MLYDSISQLDKCKFLLDIFRKRGQRLYDSYWPLQFWFDDKKIIFAVVGTFLYWRCGVSIPVPLTC